MILHLLTSIHVTENLLLLVNLLMVCLKASIGNNFQWIGCSNGADATEMLTQPMLSTTNVEAE